MLYKMVLLIYDSYQLVYILQNVMLLLFTADAQRAKANKAAKYDCQHQYT